MLEQSSSWLDCSRACPSTSGGGRLDAAVSRCGSWARPWWWWSSLETWTSYIQRWSGDQSEESNAPSCLYRSKPGQRDEIIYRQSTFNWTGTRGLGHIITWIYCVLDWTTVSSIPLAANGVYTRLPFDMYLISYCTYKYNCQLCASVI